MNARDPEGAHAHSANHRSDIETSTCCGCFFCLSIFHFADVAEPEWIDEDSTLLCPFCSVDSVIPSGVGYPITKEFLAEMKKLWF
jgi:hypothetical protein